MLTCDPDLQKDRCFSLLLAGSLMNVDTEVVSGSDEQPNNYSMVCVWYRRVAH